MALEVIKGRQWATSEEVVKVVEGLLEQARRGELVSLAYVAERPDSTLQSMHTRMENVYQAGGLMMSMAMRLLGFLDTRKREPI